MIAVVAANNAVGVGIDLTLNRFGGYDTAVVGTELVGEESVHLVRWLFVVP